MLVFVYNADAGKLAGMLDTAHKLISPSTYNCRLCALTYGLIKEKQQWQEFRRSLSEEVIFLHRDEFAAHYTDVQNVPLPVLLRDTNHQISILLDATAINSAADTAQLISLCKAAAS